MLSLDYWELYFVVEAASNAHQILLLAPKHTHSKESKHPLFTTRHQPAPELQNAADLSDLSVQERSQQREKWILSICAVY